NLVQVPNPWRASIPGERPIVIETEKNLTYQTRELRVLRSEPIQLTLKNPDVVPHNWALLKPESLRTVGEMANRMIADPEAVSRHYIPKSDLVLAWTDVVPSGESFAISFRAPETPGRYPFLCTFPGHWMVMNGVMIVE
ncbi:MAG: plastocyanin/azurin family copper-binding protein, partial [Phycisphaerae bacterium]